MPSHAQTARQYFTELRDANSFNHYPEKYVCFNDDDSPSFAVVSTTKDIIDSMTRSGDKEGARGVAKAGDGLYVQTYYKGVPNEPAFYRNAEGEKGSYHIDFDAPIRHGRMVYRINWKTGRFLLLVYALDRSKDIPAAKTSGKCELIHAGDKPSVEANSQ